MEEGWPSTGHVADPMLFFNATTPEELDANVSRMIASVDACLDLARLRSSTMSEYLIKSGDRRLTTARPPTARPARVRLDRSGAGGITYARPSALLPVGPATTSEEAPVGLSIGIVGLPNVGKSTLFNALTRNEVLAANYPFATIEPNVGVVAVPDHRLDRLAELFESKEIVPATVTFVDIAGIVKGASEGEGLGNKFLAAIRESDAICQVVRVFTDPDVIHVDGRIAPGDDIETINTELILADLQTVDNRHGQAGQGVPQAARAGAGAPGGRAGPDHPRPAGGPSPRRWRPARSTRRCWPTCTC